MQAIFGFPGGPRDRFFKPQIDVFWAAIFHAEGGSWTNNTQQDMSDAIAAKTRWFCLEGHAPGWKSFRLGACAWYTMRSLSSRRQSSYSIPYLAAS